MYLAKYSGGMMMRSNKIQTVTPSLSAVKQEYQAEKEIQNFLKAMHSYPERFAQNPALSFEDHLFTITAQSEQPHFA
jgi:hypothetical protein